jgi:Na+-translocating ferredoxin:NAD+ oxidoreductase RnfG subunit
MALDSFEPFLVSGATLTSKAYGDAVKAALQAFTVANGGEVDLRDPAQILQDNCNAALGTEGKTFEKWFASEEIGVDALYITDGGAVALIYGYYVGITADGTVSTEGVNAETGEKEVVGDGHYAAANSAYIIYSDSTLTELTSLPKDIKTKIVKKVYVTGSGNYVFELEAQGYDILMGYGTNVPIKIKLSISADGKIIDCLTVSHSESKGFGDVCATEEYYDEYRGASASDIVISVTAPDDHQDQISDDNTDIGAISSATFTTYGYQKAVEAAFDAYEILTGGKE